MGDQYHIATFRILEDFIFEDIDRAKDFRIDPEWYAIELTNHWSTIRFFPPADSFAKLCWDRQIGEKEFSPYTYLTDDYQSIIISGPDYEYILWHRSVVPGHIHLFVWRDSEMADNILELKTDTTMEDIENAFGRLLD